MSENTLEIWKTITTAALLGTARQPFGIPNMEGGLGDLLDQLSVKEPEEKLLGAAAVLGAYFQAGRLPQADLTEMPTACPPETLPVCNSAVYRMLSMMLAGQRGDVLPEALRAVAAAGLRAPVSTLPALLEFGKKQRDLRSLILPVIGERGRWLGGQNEQWSYAAGLISVDESDAEAERLWQEGSRDARRLLLQQLRARHPSNAVALLESTWTGDSADDRVAFVQTLRVGLSMADEPFLESALENRSKEVRRNAAALLAALPQSRFSARMIARADNIFTLKRSLIGVQSLQVTLPEECDKAMQADGIEPKSPSSAVGEKAWWMIQIVSAVPLSHWVNSWRKSPPDLIAFAAKSEWAEPILLGWTSSAKESGDPEWIAALVRYSLSHGKQPASELLGALDCLSVEQFETLAMEALKADPNPLHDGHPALNILKRYPGRWTDRLAREVVQSVRNGIAKGSGQEQLWHTQAAFKEFALHIAPGLSQEFAEDWPDDENPHWIRWRRHVEEFLEIMQFRHDLLKEIYS